MGNVSRRATVGAAAVIGLLMFSACASRDQHGGDKTAVPSSSSAAADPTTGGPSGRGPGDELCRIDADGGTYYLAVTSLTEHDLSECDAGTPIEGWITELFDLGQGIDKRCVYDPVTDPGVHAIVGVYSSPREADENAALGQCLAHKATYT